jgi:hypothetical protein
MLKFVSARKRRPDLRYCQICGLQHDLSVPSDGNQEPYRLIGCPQCNKLSGCFVCRGCDIICRYCRIPFEEEKV